MPQWGGHVADRVSKSNLRDWLYTPRNDGELSGPTVSKIKTMMGTIYNWGQFEGLVTTNSAIGWRLEDVGSNYVPTSVREIAPQGLFLCHRDDRRLIESTDGLIEERCGEFSEEHGIDDSAETKAWIRANSRSEVMADITLSGGSRFAWISIGSWKSCTRRGIRVDTSQYMIRAAARSSLRTLYLGIAYPGGTGARRSLRLTDICSSTCAQSKRCGN